MCSLCFHSARGLIMQVYNRYFSGHCSQTASTRPLEIASLRGNCTQSSQLRVEEVKKKKKKVGSFASIWRILYRGETSYSFRAICRIYDQLRLSLWLRCSSASPSFQTCFLYSPVGVDLQYSLAPKYLSQSLLPGKLTGSQSSINTYWLVAWLRFILG